VKSRMSPARAIRIVRLEVSRKLRSRKIAVESGFHSVTLIRLNDVPPTEDKVVNCFKSLQFQFPFIQNLFRFLSPGLNNNII